MNRMIKEDSGMVLDGDFTGASFASLRRIDEDMFEIQCLQEENVLQAALGRVFYDYNFAVRIANHGDHSRRVTIRLQLCFRSGTRNMKFMMGPYWVRTHHDWRRLKPSDHRNGADWVETTITVSPNESLILASNPFRTNEEIKEMLEGYETNLSFVAKRSLGRTDEGRDIWAIETPEQSQRIVVSGSFQACETAVDAVLSILDWLGTGQNYTEELLREFQFALIPEPVPDGVAHGLSIMNTEGRCPMFDFGKASRNEPCAQEANIVWNDLKAAPPVLFLDVHVHPGKYSEPKLNPVKPESFTDAQAARRSERVRSAILACCPQWRVVSIPLDTPDFTMQDSLPVLLARHFQTAAFCFQDYAHTPEGAKWLLVSVLKAACDELGYAGQKNHKKG